MLTREEVMAHLEAMETHDPAYAAKAHKWYSGMLPWLGLPVWGAQ